MKQRSRNLQNLTILQLLLVLMQTPVLATTYYVAKTGADNNPGSQTQPWLSIQKAADAMSAGDCVMVAAGDYAERVTSKVDGTETSPIRFVANGPVSVGGFVISKNWQIIEGFQINGTNVTGYQGLIDVVPGGNNLLARSNTLSTMIPLLYLVRCGSTSTPQPTNAVFDSNRFLENVYQGISLSGFGHLLTNNYFSSTNGGDAVRVFASNSRITRNVFTNWSNLVGSANHTDLIQTFSSNGETSTNILIDGNLFVNCRNTQIGNIADEQQLGLIGWWTWRNNIWANVDAIISIYAHDFYFYNNVFYRTGTNSGSPLMFRTSTDRGNADGGKVFNNAFVECGANPSSPSQGWYHADAGLSNFTANHNLVVGTGIGTAKTGFQTSALEANGINGQLPQFVNAPALDFRLRIISPCIGTAQVLNDLFTTDFAGVVRGTSWDIGAYQSQPGPLPPTNLRPVPPVGL